MEQLKQQIEAFIAGVISIGLNVGSGWITWMDQLGSILANLASIAVAAIAIYKFFSSKKSTTKKSDEGDK